MLLYIYKIQEKRVFICVYMLRAGSTLLGERSRTNWDWELAAAAEIAARLASNAHIDIYTRRKRATEREGGVCTRQPSLTIGQKHTTAMSAWGANWAHFGTLCVDLCVCVCIQRFHHHITHPHMHAREKDRYCTAATRENHLLRSAEWQPFYEKINLGVVFFYVLCTGVSLFIKQSEAHCHQILRYI